MHRLQEFVRLHRLGTGAREVARLLQMSPNTERRYRLALEAAGLLQGASSPLPPLDVLKGAVQAQRPPPAQTAHETSSIEAWREQVKAPWKQGMTARPIYDRLRQEEGAFQGSYWAVKRLCRRLARQRGVRAADVAIPVETGPGEVAQVDFGYTGRLLCPDAHVLRHAWVFVMVLGYSRHMFAEVVFDQKATTWLQLHRRAFEAFGGVVQTLVPDNLKAAVIRAAFAVDGDSELHRSYRELARHYGCKVDPTPPYAPRKKGKVESAVKYVKRNALAGIGALKQASTLAYEDRSETDKNEAEPESVINVAGYEFHISSRHAYKFHERSIYSHPGLAGTQKEVELAIMKQALQRHLAGALPRIGAVGKMSESNYAVEVNGVHIAYLAWSPAPTSRRIFISDYMAKVPEGLRKPSSRSGGQAASRQAATAAPAGHDRGGPRARETEGSPA